MRLDRAAKAAFSSPNSRPGCCSPCAIFSSEVDAQLPVREKADLAALSRRACLRHPNGEERCIACKLCEAISARAQAITIEAGPRRNDIWHGRAALRHRHGEMHLLRAVPGGPVDAIVEGRLRIRHRDARRALLRQERLLANGDRWSAKSPRFRSMRRIGEWDVGLFRHRCGSRHPPGGEGRRRAVAKRRVLGELCLPFTPPVPLPRCARSSTTLLQGGVKKPPGRSQ